MLLQEFYRGKIRPGESELTEEQKKNMSIVSAYQNVLLSVVDKQNAELCRKIWDEMNAASARDCEIMYVQGMRMGARLALALLSEKGV